MFHTGSLCSRAGHKHKQIEQADGAVRSLGLTLHKLTCTPKRGHVSWQNARRGTCMITELSWAGSKRKGRGQGCALEDGRRPLPGLVNQGGLGFKHAR